MPHLRLLHMMLHLHRHRLLHRHLQWHPRRRAAPCVRAVAAVRQQRVRPYVVNGAYRRRRSTRRSVSRALAGCAGTSLAGARGAEGVEGGELAAETRERDAPAMPGGGLRFC